MNSYFILLLLKRLDGFVSYKHTAFDSQDVNWWTGVCGLLVDYCDVFISCLDSHSDGTHSLQSIHWWGRDGMLHFSKSDEETNSSKKTQVSFMVKRDAETHFSSKSFGEKKFDITHLLKITETSADSKPIRLWKAKDPAAFEHKQYLIWLDLI